jgi:putative hydrolase of the HAD superfamily
MKKIISFDLDGTLVDARYGDMVWNVGIPSEYAKKYGMTFDEARAFIRGEYESVGDGDITWYEIEHWLERFSLDVAPAELLDRYAEHIALLPGAREVVDTLGDRYTLVIASNAARIFVDKELGQTGLSGSFSRVVSATSDYGMVKKQGDFFLRLLAEIGALPHEVVHVGDHPVFDHDVPSGLGIESYYVDGRDGQEGSRPRRTISGLKDLLEVL